MVVLEFLLVVSLFSGTGASRHGAKKGAMIGIAHGATQCQTVTQGAIHGTLIASFGIYRRDEWCLKFNPTTACLREHSRISDCFESYSSWRSLGINPASRIADASASNFVR
eukprot:157234_1